jgi:hypothetical protein
MAAPIQFYPPITEPEPRLEWTTSLNLREGFGYHDNIVLGALNQVGTAFFNTSVELFIHRLPLEGTEFSLLFSGDDQRLLDAFLFGEEVVDKQQTFVTQLQLKNYFAKKWSGSLIFQHVYLSQVMDVSDTEVNFGRVLAQGHTFTLRPSVHYEFAKNWWADVEFESTRQFWEAPLDDYWQIGPHVALGHDYGNRSSLSIGGRTLWRPFDDSRELTAGGASIPGTTLEFLRSTAEATWKHRWDTARHWSTSARVFYFLNQDNGSGYYDYDGPGAQAWVQYESKDWLAKVSARYTRAEYDVQRLASGDLRWRDEIDVEARLEYLLQPKLRLYLNFEHIRSRGNLRFDEYDANIGSVGVDWEI